MQKHKHFFCAFLAAAFVSTPLLADPKPRGAKPPNAQTLANIYAGRTDIWRDCKGGVYFGGKWQAQATCPRDGENVGVGTWSVRKGGRVCWTLTWYWPQGDGRGSKPAETNCHTNLVDANGTIWRNWDGDAEWWRLDTSAVKRNEIKRPVNRIRRKLGV